MKYFTKGLHKKTSLLFLIALLLLLTHSFVYAVTETIQYGYDNDRQITGVIYDDGTDIEYVYDNSGNRLFKTVTAGTPVNNPPFAASDPSIPDGATDVSTTPSTLSWTGGDPDAGDDVVYFLYFGECGYESLVFTGTIPGYPPGQLNSIVNYCWQIVSRDNHNEETVGPVWSFTTLNDAPALPAMVSPSDGSTVYATSANLIWSSSDPNPDDTVTYDIYFGTSNPPPLIQSGYPESIYTVHNINKDITYFWQIVAKDDHNAVPLDPSPVWSFTGDYIIPTQIITGSLESVSEYHTYPITLKAGDVVQARLGFTDEYPGAEPYVILYDTDGTTYMCSGVSNAGGSADLAYGCQISADGTYFIRVADSLGDDLGGEYHLAVELLNNSIAAMSYGDTVTGTLTAKSDLTVHTFAASADDMIAVTMGFTTAGPDPEMLIYGPDGTVVSLASCWKFKTNSTDNQSASMYECRLPADGIYTVLTREYYGNETGGDYNLIIERLNNPAATMVYGDTITDTLAVMQDLNIHTFAASANDTVAVWMGFATAGPDPYFRVYGPDGAYLSCKGSYLNQSTDQMPARDHECDLSGSEGIYTILVFENQGNELGGDYNLTIERLNNSEVTMAYGDTVNGTMTVRADLDTYTFAASEDTTVKVRLDFLTAGPDPQLRIYDPDGNYVCGLVSLGSTAEISSCLLSLDGIYTIVVNDYYGNKIVGDYTLYLECPPESVNCNIPPAANAGGPYSGVEGQTIILDGSASIDSDGGTITLYEWDIDNNGTYDYSSAVPSQNHTYAQNGTYTIKLRVTDNDSGTGTSVTTAIVADTSPTADFTGNPTSGPAPLMVNFTNSSYGYDTLLSYAWDFDNNATTDSIDPNPAFIYNTQGLYSVKLTVTDADGSPGSLTKTGYITVTESLYTLSVTKDGTGTGGVTSLPAGIDCGADCTEQYNGGTVVTLTAEPDTDMVFTGWLGGGCSGTADCIVTLNADTIVTATFDIFCNDIDSDGYGNPGSPSCTSGSADDCNDNDPLIYPGASEVCDGKDNDCNSLIDDSCSTSYYFYTTSACGNQQYSQIPQYSVFGTVTGECASPDSVGKTFKGMKDLLIGYLNNGGYADNTLIEGQATENLISLWVSGGDSTGYVQLVEVNPADGTVIQTLSLVSQPLYDGTYGYFTDLSGLSGTVSAGNTFGIMISADSPSRHWHEIKYGMTDGSTSDAEQYISVIETTQTITCSDDDSDGYGFPGGDATCQNGPAEDCNDSDPNINPGATEGPEGNATCSDEADNDCDGSTDGSDPDCQGGGCNSNGICDPGEDCQTCSNDCAGQLSGKPSNRYCCGDGIQQGPEGDGSICDGNY